MLRSKRHSRWKNQLSIKWDGSWLRVKGQKHIRLNNSHSSQVRSESNCQKVLETGQLTSYQSQIRIRIKLSKYTWDWTTHMLPKPDQNQNWLVKMHFRQVNSPAIKARSESESNFQITLETEQLTYYQSPIRIKIKFSKNIWTTHTLPKPDQNQNQIVKEHMRLNSSQSIKATSEPESNCQKTLETEQLTCYQSQIRIRIKLPKKETLKTEQLTFYQIQIRIWIKYLRLNNSHSIKARSESETNC